MKLVLTALLCMTAGTACAGPWPRPPGEAFGAVSHEIRDGAGWTAFYAEYGWSERLTLVLDAGQDALDGDWTAIAAVRMPLWQYGPHRFAMTFGAGLERASFEIWGVSEGNLDIPEEYARKVLVAEGSENRTLVHAGLGWGMGLDTRFGPGWATLDAVMRQATDGVHVQHKLDGTFGVNLSDRRAVFGQAQYSDETGEGSQLRLGLGWVERFGKFALEAGVGQRLREDRETDAKIGLWFTF